MTETSEEMLARVRRAARRRSELAAARLPEVGPWRARRQDVQLWQDELGEWFIAGPSGRAIPATDWEVSLWLEVVELRLAVRSLTGCKDG